MINDMIEFFSAAPFFELILILIAKVVEVTIGTIRMIMIAKGYRKEGTLLAVFEILLWVFIASRVIEGIRLAPIKGVVYALGFALGVYIGSLIEQKLAVGKISIQVITEPTRAIDIMIHLRENGHGVTSMKAQGKDKKRTVLLIFSNRKNSEEIKHIIKKSDPKALLVANEVSLVDGGYVRPWRRIIK